MPPPFQTAGLDTTPILPPLAFHGSLVDSSPTLETQPILLPHVSEVPVTGRPPGLAMTSESSGSPATPELLQSRSSTSSDPSSRPPTPGYASLDTRDQMSASSTIIPLQPVNALGLSQRRHFKGEHLDLRVKESVSPSTLSPNSAFLSPFLSPSLTPRTSLLERMSSIVNRSPSPSPSSGSHPGPKSASAKAKAVRELVYNEGPFASRTKEDDPIPEPFWSREAEASVGADLYDFGAYFAPAPQHATRKNSRQYRTVRWPPIRPQTLVHQHSIPVRCDVFDQSPSSQVDDNKIRARKRERRATQIHSAQLFTGSPPSLSYIRGGSPGLGAFVHEFPAELHSRLLSADVPSQQPKADPEPEKNQARQIGELIDLMAGGAGISDAGGDSVHVRSLPVVLHAL
ncbi:unnamed protein product [Peniophora sp. CBMAI 1063]|nr:unnamed protein product [Peniophora sp. CBMAI 1063]